MGRNGSVRLAVVAAIAVCGCWVSAAPQAQPDLGGLMTRVAERVAGYYRRAQHVICLELSTVQPIGSNRSPEGLARTVESDLRVEFEAGDGRTIPEAKMIREVRRINGRAPRERDRKDRSGCTDPNPLSPEPLAFLLPAHRDDYRFTAVREGKERNRPAIVVDFTSTSRASRPELVEEGAHDDCFDWKGPVAVRGRLWVDAGTHEVLRVDRSLHGPVDVRVPWSLQRRYNFDAWVVLERDDLSLRYKSIPFSDPDEVLLLPESIDSVTLLRGGLQSIRRSESFRDYRRFLTAGRIVREP